MEIGILTVIISGLFLLIGVVLGIGSQWLLERLNKASKEKERMIALYADWISAIDSNFHAYIHQHNGGSSYSHIENQIRLFEKNEALLTQINNIHQCIPDFESNDFKEMNFEATHRPDWDDPNFRKELNVLIQMIRKIF